MTVRGGGNPRDSAGLAGVDIDDEHYARAPEPVASRGRGSEPPRAGGRQPQAPRGRSSFGLGGLLRLVLFIGVLAGIVLIVSLTVLRPVVAGAVVDWATDNPSALRLPFVADLVREDLGTAMTEPMSSDGGQVEFPSSTAIRRPRSRTGSRSRASWATPGRSSSSRPTASWPASSRPGPTSCART